MNNNQGEKMEGIMNVAGQVIKMPLEPKPNFINIANDFPGDFNIAEFMEGTFWTDGRVVKINGDIIPQVCRTQIDSRKELAHIIIDTFGHEPRVIDNKAFVYRIVLKLVD